MRELSTSEAISNLGILLTNLIEFREAEQMTTNGSIPCETDWDCLEFNYVSLSETYEERGWMELTKNRIQFALESANNVNAIVRSLSQ